MSIPLRVLVCDDELMARKRVLRLLSELPGIEATFECESGEQVLAKLAEEDVDVAILDINMPGLSGLETVMQMPEDRPYVVFLTAHPEHAVQAFDVGAVDYVLKPVDDARLAKAITRARQSLDHGHAGDREASAAARSGPAATKPGKLAIATHDGAALVNPGDVTHATFDGALVTVHTADRLDSHRRHPPGSRGEAPAGPVRASPPARDRQPRPCRSARVGRFGRLRGVPLDRQTRRRLAAECPKTATPAGFAIGSKCETCSTAAA